MLLGILGGKLFSPSQWRQLQGGPRAGPVQRDPGHHAGKTRPGNSPVEEMNAAIGVIESRVNGTGNSGAQVQPQGNNLLIVTVPGKGSEQTIQLVSAKALLLFRQVLLFEPYSATAPPRLPRLALAHRPAPAPRPAPVLRRARARRPAPPARRVPPPRSSRTSRPAPRRARPRVPRPAPHRRATASPSPGSPSCHLVGPPCTKQPGLTAGDASLVNKQERSPCSTSWSASPATRRRGRTRSATETADYDNPNAQIVSCGYNGNSQWGKFALDKAKVLGTG